MSDSESSISIPESPKLTKKMNTDFIFPPPPRLNFSDGSSDDSDMSDDIQETVSRPRISRRNGFHCISQNSEDLPPIGFFWDIENCQVPKGCSAIAVVSAIRNVFLAGRREVEFVVVCDTRKELPTLLQDLNDAQINLLHVCGTQKNAADEKLRQCMRRYAELHASNPVLFKNSQLRPAVLLISGDINFAADLSDFRYRKKMEVILIHMNASQALISCANQHHNFTSITTQLPRIQRQAVDTTSYNLDVTGLPILPCALLSSISRRLSQLADNCGGKVIRVQPPNAVIRFKTQHQYLRALKRMDGEDVFKHKIRVLPSAKGQYNGIRSSSDEGYNTASTRSTSAPLSQAPVMPPMPTFTPLQPQPTQRAQSNGVWHNGSLVNSHSEDNIGRNNIQRPTPRTPLGYRSIRGTHRNRKSYNDYSESGSKQKVSPSPSPVPSLSPAASVTPSPSPSPTMMEAHNWNISEHSTSEHSDTRSGSPLTSYVDITVTNLEHSADPMDVRSMLHRIFSEHVPVVDVSIRGSAETLWARVRVCGTGAAQLAVARLHRRRVAGRRLLLSLAPPPPPTSLPLLRLQVASLLQASPDQQLPLFRLRELYATKHGRALPAAEVARLRDTCLLVDSPRGRSVKLIRPPPTHSYPMQSQLQNQEWWNESDVCKLHGRIHNEDDDENVTGGVGLLPVYLELPVLSHRLHSMLSEHGGGLLLNGFPHCYQVQFGEALIIDQSKGVPLEHLLSCVRSVTLRNLPPPKARKCIVPNLSNTSIEGSGQASEDDVPGSLVSLRTLLSRELLDLLRTVPRCQMPFSRLIPSYHLHFGRQCRVADYGFTRLADLLDALSHTVQVMGEGSGRVITLSHSAQMKRFTADLLKVLRAQPDKSLMLQNLPELYQKCLGREFEAVEYGACRLEDLISSVARYCVAFGPEEGRISLPRHRQTPEEVARMRHFASQASELLRHAPNCRLELSRFVPAYHTHFGRQLRVAHYGLPKVQDLFHAIPDTVEMWVNEEGERVVGLRPEAARRVVGAQLAALPLPLTLASLPHTYRSLHGHALLPSAYGCPDLITLLRVLPNLKVVEGCGEGGALIIRNSKWSSETGMISEQNTSENKQITGIMKKVPKSEPITGWGATALLAYSVLASDRCVSNGGSPLLQFQKEFQEAAGYEPPLTILEQKDCIKLMNGNVLLSPLWRCIGRMVGLQKDTTLTLQEINIAYQQHYTHSLPYRELGFHTLEALIDYCCDIWERSSAGQVRVRPGLSKLLPLDNKSTTDLLPSTPPGQKSGVWCTPPSVPCGPWKMSPAPPAPNMLPLPTAQLLGPAKRKNGRIRLAAQFDSPT